MVQLMEGILEDYLHTTPAPAPLAQLPSPEQLKYKILVKAKKPQGSGVESDDEPDEAIGYIDEEDGAALSKSKPHKPLAPELARIVNICEGKKFKSFEASRAEDSPA